MHTGADNVLSVLVENMGHNEDYKEEDSHKEARGLTGATFDGGTPTTVKWLIQGAQGGENGADPVRGPMNNGGLFGERNGWSKPEFNDSAWKSVSPAGTGTPPRACRGTART